MHGGLNNSSCMLAALLHRPLGARSAAVSGNSHAARNRLCRVERLEDRLALTLFGQSLFPADSPGNQNISAAPVAANSAAVISIIGGSVHIHPDWGADDPSNGTAP